MHTLTAEDVRIIKAVAKADSLADMTFRRHNLGQADEATTVYLTWNERNKITKESERKSLELPWTAFGITDYGNRTKRHGYAHMGIVFTLFAGLIREGDEVSLDVTLSEHDYGHAYLEIGRRGKTGRKSVYRGYVDVGRVGNFFSES